MNQTLRNQGIHSPSPVNHNTLVDVVTGGFATFSILDHLDALNMVRESRSEIVADCPLCGTEGSLKIDPKTGKYFTFKCNCMDTDQGKKSLIQAIAPMEKNSYRSPRPQTPKKSKQSAKLPPIEGPVKLARFDVIPTDAPLHHKHPNWIPQKAREARVNNSQVTEIFYSYSPNHMITRYEWPDAQKHKGHDKTFTQSHRDESGNWKNTKGDQPWPLYRENEAITANGWILFQEGEECVETARRFLGLVSVTLQGSNWTKDTEPALTRLKPVFRTNLEIIKIDSKIVTE